MLNTMRASSTSNLTMTGVTGGLRLVTGGGGGGGGGWGDAKANAAVDGSTLVTVRISIADLGQQRVLQARLDDLVWNVKLKLLAIVGKDLKDGLNFGLYSPPQGGKAGKFLDEERPLSDYPFSEPVGHLEFKYKRRVYKLMQISPKKLKQLHTKANLKQFVSAVQSGDVAKINKLTLRGIDPNFHDRDVGETPLTLACAMKKSRDVILSLVAGGAHIDFRNKDGYTPMHRAAALGHYEVIQTLLELGASPNCKDANGLTPLYLCVCGVTPAKCAELLLHDRAVLDTCDSAGWTETHQACRVGRVQHLEHLLFYGAEMNAQVNNGNTPLHVCAQNNQESCARVLLFRGADREVQNFSGQTAFQLAVVSGHFDLAEIIRTFSDDDVVPFQEMPQYNDKRRSVVPAMGQLQRWRSNPNLAMHASDASASSSKPASPALSNNSLPQSSDGINTPYSRKHVRITPPESLSTGSAGSLHGRSRSYIEDTTEYIGSVGPRTVVLQRSAAGFGFVLRGLKGKADIQPTGFAPTSDFPSLQCLQHVDAGGVAEKAGLKAGDFILEVNGVDVSKSSHDIAVNLIRQSGDTVLMRVMTVTPSSVNDDNAFMYPTTYSTLPLKRAPSSNSKSNGGLKHAKDLKNDETRMRSTSGTGQSINQSAALAGNRNWLDRPMAGFGRMRAAISCGDLSQNVDHMSVYNDIDGDDDDLSSYSALNNANNKRRNERSEPQRHDSDIVNEQTGRRIPVNVVTDSPVIASHSQRTQNTSSSGRNGPQAFATGGIDREDSASNERNQRSDWLPKYAGSNGASFETSRPKDFARFGERSGPGVDEPEFDVDSLIVPCPPDFSSTMPIVDIPFVPPPALGMEDDDDLEGEMVPISLQEYSSGSDSVRSRKSTRSSERISTFFAPPPATAGSEDTDSGRGHSFDESTASPMMLPPPPPPPGDDNMSTLQSTDKRHQKSDTHSLSRSSYQSSRTLSAATSVTSLTSSNTNTSGGSSSRLSTQTGSTLDGNRQKQQQLATGTTSTSSAADTDPSHAALLAAIARRRQSMHDGVSDDDEETEDHNPLRGKGSNQVQSQQRRWASHQQLDAADTNNSSKTAWQAVSKPPVGSVPMATNPATKVLQPASNARNISQSSHNSQSYEGLAYPANASKTPAPKTTAPSLKPGGNVVGSVGKGNVVAAPSAANANKMGGSQLQSNVTIDAAGRGVFVVRPSSGLPMSRINSARSEDTDGGEDFLSLAEKARQQWLQQQQQKPSLVIPPPALDNEVTTKPRSRVESSFAAGSLNELAMHASASSAYNSTATASSARRASLEMAHPASSNKTISSNSRQISGSVDALQTFEEHLNDVDSSLTLPPPPDSFLTSSLDSDSGQPLPPAFVDHVDHVDHVDIVPPPFSNDVTEFGIVRPSAVKQREAPRVPRLISEAVANKIQNNRDSPVHVANNGGVAANSKTSSSSANAITSSSLMSAKSALRSSGISAPAAGISSSNIASAPPPPPPLHPTNGDRSSLAYAKPAVAAATGLRKSNDAKVQQSTTYQNGTDFRRDENFAAVIALQAASRQRKLDSLVDGKGSIRKSQLTGQRVVYTSATRFGHVVDNNNGDSNDNVAKQQHGPNKPYSATGSSSGSVVAAIKAGMNNSNNNNKTNNNFGTSTATQKPINAAANANIGSNKFGLTTNSATSNNAAVNAALAQQRKIAAASSLQSQQPTQSRVSAAAAKFGGGTSSNVSSASSAELPPPPEFDFDFERPGRVFMDDGNATVL